MRAWAAGRAAGLVVSAAVLAACSTSPVPEQVPTTSPAPQVKAPKGFSAVTVEVPEELARPPFDVPRQAVVPNGWTMSVWARIPRARLAVWAPDGALLVSVPANGEVVRLMPSSDGPPHRSLLLEALTLPHGLGFAGSTLYVAESDEINVYTYKDGKATGRKTVVDDLPDAKSLDLHGAYTHQLKSVAVGHDGAVYFSIGSTGNITAEDRVANPPRATIMRIPPGGGPARPFATGVRNGTGLAVAPDGAVWTAVNGRDNVPYPGPGPSYGKVIQDYVNNHPPEQVAKLTPGRELGWPYCNSDGGPANLPFIRDVQTNPDGRKLHCARLPPVEQSMPAHAAPLGMSFAQLPEPFGRGALIGVHGSWNREPPQPPEVAFFPWRNGNLGNQQTLVGGFQADDGSRWGRPVAAVAGPDGAIYITDDHGNAVYRLAPPGV
ncbi:PQQ-dependent sugar dehydrogenase [Mycobacterium hubeiense]|uniref:PQQ-dependent sugar dehydrogenase n=1 Tax=Mycobacterium hubeiense TaxID=1867256 RepID=UPI000C7F74A4|nr:gluconolaconase [Mycobacterium sp. QGD 101]